MFKIKQMKWMTKKNFLLLIMMFIFTLFSNVYADNSSVRNSSIDLSKKAQIKKQESKQKKKSIKPKSSNKANSDFTEKTSEKKIEGKATPSNNQLLYKKVKELYSEFSESLKKGSNKTLVEKMFKSSKQNNTHRKSQNVKTVHNTNSSNKTKERYIVRERKKQQSGKAELIVKRKDLINIPDYFHVYPEEKNYVVISKIDINRLVCEKGKVMGLFYSKDKGIITKKADNNLFVRIIPGSFAFSHPFELYVECGDNSKRFIYPLIVTSERVSTKTVILHKPKILTQEQKDFFKKNTRTSSIIKLIKQAYKETFSESFIVKKVFTPINPLSFEISPTKAKIIKYMQVDTGKWILDLFFIDALENLKLKEEQFVKENTIAVSVFDAVLHKGQFGKIVIIREKSVKEIR